jgi:isocitrate dehydrogenase
MMLAYMGWKEAADSIRQGLQAAIRNRRVTYDLARQIEGAVEISCSAFAQEIVSGIPR